MKQTPPRRLCVRIITGWGLYMLIKRKHLFGTTVLAGVVALAAPAFAQDQLPGVTATGQQDQEATEIGEIVVTGSRIRRDPTNAPTPIIQVEREALLTTGQSTVIDYLATIPALSNSLVPSDTTGSGLNDGGLDFANLRSLGTGRTLTLVDGRRHVGSSRGTLSVDVSTIPRLLIENIEIVTGGASSVYGADAVAGVLNFSLRDDFEGLEIDANYGQINQNGEVTGRVSVLSGANLLDDRLNVYAFGEYEKQDEVTSLDVDWIARTPLVLGIDADPTTAPYDGFMDNAYFENVLRMDRPRWGQTTLANSQQASPLSDPDIPYFTCHTAGGSFTWNSNCFAPNPGKTFWYPAGTGTARLAEFGQRIGNTGAVRPYNIGGDGVSPAWFSSGSRFPEIESQRYQVGSTFSITDNLRAKLEAKFVTEDVNDVSQPTFFNIDLINSYGSRQASPLYGTPSFELRWTDNAFLPQIVKDAIATNSVIRWNAPTANAPSTPGATFATPIARHQMFGPDRFQQNTREVTRYVAALEGEFDSLWFVRNVAWDIGYTYGEMDNVNVEAGVDVQRFQWAADSVVDVAGVMGTPGAIVCRIALAAAEGVPNGQLRDYWRGGDIRDSAYGQQAIDECRPLNVFGEGNQDQAALDYVYADIAVRERNEQEQAQANIAGELWDFWGAGPIGMALGYEHRREYTRGIGRSADTAGRLLFLNTGPDFQPAEYESDEFYGEMSLPLFRDSWLGEYAELSGSYRWSDYTTVGEVDVYGVNLVYRPIEDIAFRTSFNTSVRVPNLAENFAPATQTFWNGVVDPCATTSINAPGLAADIRQNRINNCTALAAQKGLTFDFAGATATNTDDYNPVYTSGIAGVNAGNPFLLPEESESFTFSTILRPRFIPNFSLVLDYYEIEVTNVISAVSAAAAAANCVNGPTLDAAACATIFRNNPNIPFGIGAPAGDPIGGFIQGSINFAALKTRGLDFTARYTLDTEEVLGRNLGQFNYSLGGLWLIDQQQFTNVSNPNQRTSLEGDLFYPRVRLTSSLTWVPNDTWSVNWTMDWQTAQEIASLRDSVTNLDNRPYYAYDTGNFARHDFTVRYNVRDDLSLRAGVVNAFDNEQHPWLGNALYSNFDAWGRRFFIGLNWRPY